MKTEYAKTQPNLSRSLKRLIDSYANSNSLPLYLKQRATIIKLSSEGKNDREIADLVGIHFTNVGIWRRRFLEELEELTLLTDEKQLSEARELIKYTLSDRKRTGRPKNFSKK